MLHSAFPMPRLFGSNSRAERPHRNCRANWDSSSVTFFFFFFCVPVAEPAGALNPPRCKGERTVVLPLVSFFRVLFVGCLLFCLPFVSFPCAGLRGDKFSGTPSLFPKFSLCQFFLRDARNRLFRTFFFLCFFSRSLRFFFSRPTTS